MNGEVVFGQAGVQKNRGKEKRVGNGQRERNEGSWWVLLAPFCSLCSSSCRTIDRGFFLLSFYTSWSTFSFWKGENGKIKSNDLAKVCFSFFRRTRSTLLVFGGSEEWRMELTPDACCAEESVTGIYFGILTIEKRKEATTAEGKVFFATPEKNGTFLPQSTQTLHFLAKESPVCRISSFALFDKTFSPRVFYTVPCSHFPFLFCASIFYTYASSQDSPDR